ncbi:MAG TPA: hypothetical protein VE732_03955 [Nitrososphaera sp.]|nr:hypothetical protein [Nitrososphaera sp.]
MTEDHPDWIRVYPCTFRAQWRFLIDAPVTYKNKSHYYHHYMSRWSTFISQVMAIRLSKTEIRDILPEIRNTLPADADLSDIYPLLFSRNQTLARSLLDCSAVFNNAPIELKAHILTVFSVTPEALEACLNTEPEESSAA